MPKVEAIRANISDEERQIILDRLVYLASFMLKKIGEKELIEECNTAEKNNEKINRKDDIAYKIVETDEIECLSPKEVMEILKISKSEAYNIFHSKDFPSFRLGERKIRVTKKDFKEWLNQQKKGINK